METRIPTPFWLFLGMLVVLVVVAAVGCTTPEPVVERVEVTREVELPLAVKQPVEVELPSLATHIAEQTVEPPPTREVTREVPITVVVTATPPPPVETPTPVAMPTPTPAPMPAVEPTLTSEQLSRTTSHNILIVLSNDGDYLVVEATTAFVADAFDLDVLVDGRAYCNSNRIYPDDGLAELGCESETRRHTSVERVSIQTSHGDLRCAKHVESDDVLTAFICVWR